MHLPIENVGGTHAHAHETGIAARLGLGIGQPEGRP